jgi:ribosomal protein L37AE/L43A
MESNHKCILAGCTGNLVEGVRGFLRCDTCGAKIKKSLVVPQDEITTDQQKTVAQATDTIKKEKPAKTTKQASIGDTDVIPKQKPKTTMTTTGDGTVLHGKTTAINCKDCGAERIIKVQDAFQVTRCKSCQQAFTKARRNDRLKEKRTVATKTEIVG